MAEQPFRPLTSRGISSTSFDTLHEGLPTWMHPAITRWVFRYFEDDFSVRLALVVNTLHLEPALDWTNDFSARTDLLTRMLADWDLGLNLLDYLLHFVASIEEAAILGAILISGGSAWEVTEDGKNWQLTRRGVGPVVESIDAIRTPSQRAHHHLMMSWSALMGRNPSPSTAYSQAIKAVEVAAIPIVTPDDPAATLGKIISAIRDKPGKWVTVLDKSSPEQIAGMADLIWKGQQDRHGTADPDAPLAVSQKEADAAFYIALAVVRIFVGGGISQSS